MAMMMTTQKAFLEQMMSRWDASVARQDAAMARQNTLME